MGVGFISWPRVEQLILVAGDRWSTRQWVVKYEVTSTDKKLVHVCSNQDLIIMLSPFTAYVITETEITYLVKDEIENHVGR